MSDYAEFLAGKQIDYRGVGIDIQPEQINPQLFDFQRAITSYALRKGRSAVFADCGLGKTPIQLEWSRHVVAHTNGRILILAPLAVAAQTAREGEKFGIEVTVCRSGEDVGPGINITNYDRLHHFDPSAFSGIVLDESSILKAFGGKMRRQITQFAKPIPFRLACTATPAPNDLIELTNHAEFLEVMSGKEIIALFFTQDGNTTHQWRLKGHARTEFWRWLASWAVALRSPADLGFDDSRFILPELRLHEVVIDSDGPTGDQLFVVEAQSLEERRAVKRASLGERVEACAELVNGSSEPWVIWCNLNDESAALAKSIDGAVEIVGSDEPEHKESAMLGFSSGDIRVLVTKPSIAGFGMNWQHCHNVAFVGLSDSYEQFYQALRRCWRFGQKNPVDCHVITARAEGAIVRNIKRKEAQASEMFASMVEQMSDMQMDAVGRQEMKYQEDVATGTDWTMYLGDSIEMIDRIESDSVGLSIFSPPFPGMYAYTNSVHDIGNTPDIDKMIEHFSYLVAPDKLMRILMPGRLACIHLMQLTAMKSREGYVGLHDYRGRIIEMMQNAGWIYAGEVAIDKNPQIQATRNKERGLLFKSLATDSSVMRMALADYLLYFRKPGDNPKPIRAGMSPRYNGDKGWITEREWIEWAAPVWYRQTKHYPGGIRETDVLNVVQARESDDERHLCPLQLGVIERAVKLWSAPGEIVFSPFAGIGSEGYVALQLERQFIGIELKHSYWESACRNLETALTQRTQGTLDLSA